MTPPRAPDRVGLGAGRAVAITVLLAAALWSALASLPGAGLTAAGRSLLLPSSVLCAALAVFGLPSVPVRWVVRGLSLASGALLARFGELGALGGIGGSWRALLWIACTAAALALAPSSRAVPGRQQGTAVRAADVPGTGRYGLALGGADPVRRSPLPSISLVVAAVALVGATALLIGPRAGQSFPVGARMGDALDLTDARDDNALVATDRLDMTARPRLTEEVVMTVRSQVASFWRTETFDVWNGSNWTRSDGSAALLSGGEVVPSPEDLAATRGRESEQEFRIETGYATAVPTAPSAVRVDSPVELAQRTDGTLSSPIEPMGNGTVYTVTSRQTPATPEALAAASDDVPDEVRERYASPPLATDRVIELTNRITADASNDYERIQAIEGWLDRNTEYSLDAPLSPQGVDVVDHFLFDSQLGWCEQIASSLVVMARLSGVPARLAVGFTPGEWDAVSGRFVVRERDAHAWAEVWFPEFGWVSFDPTANVPLAGTAEATAGADARDWREIAGVALLFVAAGSLFSGSGRRLVAARWRRFAAARAHRIALRGRWDVHAEDEIERRGKEAGLPRRPGDTLTSYAGAVAAAVEDPELVELAERVDRERYAPVGAGAQGGGRDYPTH